MPDRKADGTNTAHSVSAMEISAPPTSSIVSMRGLRGRHAALEIALDVLDDDDRVVDDDADREHQAEQGQVVERYPEARTRIANVPISETGIAMTGMIDARQLCRKRNTTPTTSRIATKIVYDDLVDRFAR